MNAITPIIRPAPSSLRVDALNAWHHQRGKMVEIFVRSEFAVTETLELMASFEGRGDAIKIKPTLQARFTQLAQLIGVNGVFSSEGKPVRSALQAVSDCIGFRNLLCHGQATIYIEDKGRWIVQLEMLTVVNGRAKMRSELRTDEQVRQKQIEIQRYSSQLVNQARQVKEKLVALKAVTPSAQAALASD